MNSRGWRYNIAARRRLTTLPRRKNTCEWSDTEPRRFCEDKSVLSYLWWWKNTTNKHSAQIYTHTPNPWINHTSYMHITQPTDAHYASCTQITQSIKMCYVTYMMNLRYLHILQTNYLYTSHNLPTHNTHKPVTNIQYMQCCTHLTQIQAHAST